MPAFCPLCATDEYTEEGVTDDGVRFAVCRIADHGPDGYTWEPAPPPGSRPSRPDSGLGADLDIWEKLLDCVPTGNDFAAYGVVEDEILRRFPAETRRLVDRYGHRWRRDMPRTTNNYSMSVYLAARLKELATEGLLDVRWGPAEGDWSYNGQISYWRHHTEAEGVLVTQAPRETASDLTHEAPALAEDVDDLALIVPAASVLPPAQEDYTETDFVMNLLATVIDYQLHTKAVVSALEHYKSHRWEEIRTLDDLESVMDRFDDDQSGNTALAQYLWGYNLWTRAHQLRDLAAFFRDIDVVDQPALERWAERATFEKDFRGQVKGLGPAVFQWLIMRQGIDTVKPDVHVHRFVANAIGRTLSDTEVIDVVTQAAAEMGISARELDWRIWEASRGR